MGEEQRLNNGDAYIVNVGPTCEPVSHLVEPLEVLRTELVDAEREHVDGAVAQPALAFGEQRIREIESLLEGQRPDARPEAAHNRAPGGRIQPIGNELVVFVELPVRRRRASRRRLYRGTDLGCQGVLRRAVRGCHSERRPRPRSVGCLSAKESGGVVGSYHDSLRSAQ